MKKQLVTLALIALTATSCSTWNDTAKGGAIGAGAGGVLGGIIGKQSHNTTVGVLLGAVIGGAAGGAIGHYMDKQAADLQRDLKDAKVERVGEGIKITFKSGILFDVDSDKLRPEAKQNLSELAKTLQRYSDTDVLVQGHTDSTGTPDHNKTLSEERAGSVTRELKSLGVKGGRIDDEGLGETQPVADNGSAEGRQENRRVEVAIMANDKLKKAAQKGEIQGG